MPADARDRDWRAALAALTGHPDAGAESADGRPAESAESAESAEASPAVEPTALGLRFQLRRRVPPRPGEWTGSGDEPARRGASVDRLAVRPVAAGAKGGWVQAGLNWQNIAYQGASQGYDPAQARWFGQFAMLKGGNPGVYAAHGSEWITLDAYESPLLWPLLAEAERCGIALVGSDATPEVRLHARAEPVLDATDDLDGFRLVPRLLLDGAPRTLRDARPVGRHGLYRFDFDAGLIELGPVPGGLAPGARTLLDGSDDPVRVPSPDLPGFLRTEYPRLARTVPVVSLDGTFEPPPPGPAVLVLAVRFAPGDRADLDWRWEHPDGRVEPFVDGAVATGGQDEADALDVVERAREQLDGIPMASVVLRGADASWLAARALPRLARIDRVRVDATGTAPTGDEAEGEAVLRLRSVESRDPDWFELGFMLTVGGRSVPFMPVFRALATGAKRLRLPDRSYLDLRRPEFDPLRTLIEEGADLAEWETGVRIPRSQAVLWAEFEDHADGEPGAVEWRRLVAGLEGAVEPLPPPAGVAIPLRPYQLAGFRWLAFLHASGLGGVLADDMGLGKTAQVLALIAHAVAAAPDTRPFLVVAPTSVASNWAAEAARFTPGLRVASVTATERRRRKPIADAAAGADLVVTTYPVLRLEAEAFARLDWAGLVLDEAQFVKNAATRVHDAARGIRAPFRVAVTGTPIENDLSELWAILRIVAPGLFPSRRAFDERYRRPIEQDRDAERRDRLRRRIRPLLLRRTKEQVAPELPEKQEQVLSVELAPAHRRLYDATLQRERQKLLGLMADLDRQRFTVYRSLTLLRMLALDAALIDPAHEGIPSAKLDALFEQLDDVLAEGHSALVFSQFTSFLARAASRLEAAGVPFAYLDGSTPAKRRDAEAARFRAGGASVFLISLKAGGFGLNLAEADYVFLLDPWWNPASEAQAVDRAHRIGQTRRVNVYRLVAAGTIEEKVMALKERKGALVAGVLDGIGDEIGDEIGDGVVDGGGLTAADLRELLDG
ncbi:DEAD/DEAH box helicase [Agromyces sp. MMS24-JH15]|uniref:DEAD/DEAH box helicase n=1 Tax=Agromyces sp. MMS24-JH15 TaxID=3243765 RepID=UPI00374A6EDD